MRRPFERQISGLRSRPTAETLMIRITISAAAFDAISRTLPRGGVTFERDPDAPDVRMFGSPATWAKRDDGRSPF